MDVYDITAYYAIYLFVTYVSYFNLHFQLHDEFNRVLMNLIFAEMINCTYGVSIDISAALQHGWKLGRTVCNTTGFLLTLSGEYSQTIIFFP